MDKYIHLENFITLNLYVSVLTLAFFVYKYIWFGIETVPSDRILFTFGAVLITGIFKAFSFLGRSSYSSKKYI
jgi:hypothetical protein